MGLQQNVAGPFFIIINQQPISYCKRLFCYD